MRYRFTGEHPVVVSTHSYGANANATLDPIPDPEPRPGSTLIVNPGDTVTTDDPISNVLFVDDQDLSRMRKPELVAAAEAAGLPTDGTADELRAALAAHTEGAQSS